MNLKLSSKQLHDIEKLPFEFQHQVHSILSHSPKYREISLKHGESRAVQFMAVAIAAAQRHNRIEHLPYRQPSTQQQPQI